MKYFIIILVLFTNLETQAQENTTKMTTGFFGVEVKNHLKEIKGTPYLDDNYSIYTISGAKVNDIKMLRYNHYSDQMEYLDNGVLYDLNKINKMEIFLKKSNKKYIYENYFDGSTTEYGFLELLVSEKNINLYKKVRVVLSDRIDKKDLTDVGKVIQEYTPLKPQYFLNIEKEKIISIPQKKTDFINLFDNQLIKEFIKKEKIQPNKEADLVKLIKYISNLS
ncbi:hypothetical protein [Chishuiella sp.]|uniref:hypothetical protein n=1 Tax=Chishuiella sp. TaxID=1969467 RepID=UPI0028AA3A20|nr:hypothetical protein [Chishuiella sp.]